MLPARHNHLLEASYTGSVRLRTLQEAAVAADGVAYTILCCSVKLWNTVRVVSFPTLIVSYPLMRK
jgi:hypothetical protein